MSFIDEVNSSIRTPEEIWRENAKIDYEGIKQRIKSNAYSGVFTSVGSKKRIAIDYQGRLSDLFKYDHVCKGIKATLFSPGGAYTSATYTLKNRSAFESYCSTLNDLAKKDGISIEVLGRYKRFNYADKYFKIPGKIEAHDYSIMRGDTAVVIHCVMEL
jgi:hypothetical protein